MKPQKIMQELLRLLYITGKIDLDTYAEMWKEYNW